MWALLAKTSESNNLFQLIILLAYHKRRKQQMNQSELEENTCNWSQARENACEQVTIGFTSDWSRKWCELFIPITERSEAKAKKRKLLSTLTWKPFYDYGLYK